MLMGIPKIIPPRLMMLLMEMGHGDELVIADANFPARSIAMTGLQGEVVRCEGANAVQMLEAILQLMPLDYAVDAPAIGMAAPEGTGVPIHAQFVNALAARGYGVEKLSFAPRFDFYARAEKSRVVIATGEMARFANLILKKGVVTEN